MKTELNIPDPDAFYARLAAMHEGLTPEDSLRLMSRLVLLLANQVGEQYILAECLEAAGAGATAPRSDSAMER